MNGATVSASGDQAGISVPGGTTVQVTGENSINTESSQKPGIAWHSNGDLILGGDGYLSITSSNAYSISNENPENEETPYAGALVIGDAIQLDVENTGLLGCIDLYGMECGVTVRDDAAVDLSVNENAAAIDHPHGYCMRVRNNGDIRITDKAKVRGIGVFHIEDEGLSTDDERGRFLIDSSYPVKIDGNDIGNNITIFAKEVIVEKGAELQVENTSRAVSHIQNGANLTVRGTVEIRDFHEQSSGGGNGLNLDHLKIADTGSLTMTSNLNPAQTQFLIIASNSVNVQGALTLVGGYYGIQTAADADGGVTVDGGTVVINNVSRGFVVAYSGDIVIQNDADITISSLREGLLIHNSTNPEGKVKLNDGNYVIASGNDAIVGTVEANLPASKVFAGSSADEKQEVIAPVSETWLSNYVEIRPLPALTGEVSISGILRAGKTLTAKTVGTPEGVALSYQWQVSDVADGVFTGIDGAVERVYSLTANEIDKYVRVVVTPEESADYTGELTATTTKPIADRSSGSETPTYRPTVNDTENGTVSVSPVRPEEGAQVTITLDPNAGYEVETIAVKDRDGNELAVTDNEDGTYSYTQPAGNVEITVTFRESSVAENCPRDETCPMYEFTDLDRAEWYHNGIHYCLENGLMIGTDSQVFSPEETTARAQIVTALWRLAEEPTAQYTMEFTDVRDGVWYTEAICWATAEGIVDGYGDGSFGTNDGITREQFAVILYRYAARMGYDVTAKADLSGYDDVAEISTYARDALAWADAEGIVNALSETTLDPKGMAARA